MVHLYKVGQIVDLRSAPRQSNRPAGPCEVVSRLPHDKGPVQYRVRSRGESVERVVEEMDLSPSDARKWGDEDTTEDKPVFSIAINKR